MPLTLLSLSDLFITQLARVNQLVTGMNIFNEYSANSNGSLTLLNVPGYNNNVTLNVASGMIKGDGGLLSNVGSSGIITNSKLANTGIIVISNTSSLVVSGGQSANLGSTLYINANVVSSLTDTSTSNIASANAVNSVYSLSQSASASANNAFVEAVNAYGEANSAYTLAYTANTLAISSYTLANTANILANNAYALANTATLGKHAIWVPAAGMLARVTNGAVAGAIETSNNKVMIRTLDFDTTTQQFAQFQIQMPRSWDEGTIIAQFIWSHPATTTNFGVVWALESVAIANNATYDASFGTAQQVTSTGGITNNVYISPETSAITVGGSPTPENLVIFQVKRIPADAADLMAVSARLQGVKIHYTTNAPNDN